MHLSVCIYVGPPGILPKEAEAQSMAIPVVTVITV